MKLDKFHYQEAIHMADFIRRMIDSELCGHWTYSEMTNEERCLCHDAIDSLYKYYCALAEKQDAMDEK